jgi:hypothetical protein
MFLHSALPLAISVGMPPHLFADMGDDAALTELRGHFDTLSDIVTIVVNNLPPVAKAEQHGPRGQMAKKSTSKRERLKTLDQHAVRKARHAACRMRRELSDIKMKPEPRKRLQFCSRCGDFVWFSSPAATTQPTLRTMRAPVAFSATARTARA